MSAHPDKEPCYSPRLDDALALAAEAFRHKRRKQVGTPYLAHLLQVMVTVTEQGGDEDQMIAALLHDYLEDIPGATAQELEGRFGARVARLVRALSDATDAEAKPPWEARKKDYLAHLVTEPAEVKLISAADKLHNAQSICRDLAVVGDEVWARFKPPKDRSLWYYREVVEALGQGWDHPLVAELDRTVRAMHRASGVSYSSPPASDEG